MTRVGELEAGGKPTKPTRQIDAENRLGIRRQHNMPVCRIEIAIGVPTREPNKVHES